MPRPHATRPPLHEDWFSAQTLKVLLFICANTRLRKVTTIRAVCDHLKLSRGNLRWAAQMIDTLKRHGLVKLGAGPGTATLIATCQIEVLNYVPRKRK